MLSPHLGEKSKLELIARLLRHTKYRIVTFTRYARIRTTVRTVKPGAGNYPPELAATPVGGLEVIVQRRDGRIRIRKCVK